MKNFRWWTVIGMAAAGLALSGCGGSGGDSSGDVSLRVVNATLTHASIDLLVDSDTTVSATDRDTVSDYASASDGTLTLQLNDAGGSTALTTSVRTLAKGKHYSVVAYESGGVVKTSVLSDELDLPDASNSTILRFFNAAIEAGPLDIYITSTGDCTAASLSGLNASTSFATLTAPAASSTQTQGAGSYTVCATAAGSTTDLRMTLPITIAADTVVNVIMTPSVGSALINGSVLVQQEDEYTAVRNPNSRVRLASAVSGGSDVVATATSSGTHTTIGSGVAPSFGFYRLVKASSDLNVSVEGSSVALTGSLVAGGDATLLVYGDPSSATAKLIADDNRAPSNAGATKLRMINGVTGSDGTMTLTANSSPVGIDVQAGAASGYQSLTTGNTTGVNTFVFELSSSTDGPLTLLSPEETLNASATYSILVVGDISASPQRLLIRSNQ